MSVVSWLWVVAPLAVAAAVGTALSVVVNLATGGGPWWLWLIVGLLTVVGFATSVWQYRRQSANPPGPPTSHAVDAGGGRSVAVGGEARGPISTGDRGVVPPTSPSSSTPPPRNANPTSPPPGSVAARGDRSVAIGGDAHGEIATGDQA